MNRQDNSMALIIIIIIIHELYIYIFYVFYYFSFNWLNFRAIEKTLNEQPQLRERKAAQGLMVTSSISTTIQFKIMQIFSY